MVSDRVRLNVECTILILADLMEKSCVLACCKFHSSNCNRPQSGVAFGTGASSGQERLTYCSFAHTPKKAVARGVGQRTTGSSLTVKRGPVAGADGLASTHAANAARVVHPSKLLRPLQTPPCAMQSVYGDGLPLHDESSEREQGFAAHRWRQNAHRRG